MTISNFEIDQRARKCLLSAIPDHWSLSTPTDDLGLDYWVQITKNGIPTGHSFFIQLKGTISRNLTNQKISYSLSTKKLVQYLENPSPILFVIAELNKNEADYDKAYYCWIRNHTRELIASQRQSPEWWTSQKSITIKISRKNILNQKTSNAIIEPYIRSYSIRHTSQEEQHIAESQVLYDLSRRLNNFDFFLNQHGLKGDCDEAINAKHLYLLGRLCLEESKYEESLSYFQAANKILPTPDAMLNMSYCYNSINEITLAIEACERGLKLDNTNPLLWGNLGTSFFKIGEFEKALKCHEQSAMLEPDNARMLALVGATLEYMSSMDFAKSLDLLRKSQKYYEKALQIAPDDDFILTDAGLIQDKLYKFRHAAALYEKAVSINPKNITAWIRLARARMANKEYLRAKEAIFELYKLGVDTKEVKNLEQHILMNESGEYKDSWSQLMQLMKKALMDTDDNNPTSLIQPPQKSRATD